MINISEDGWFGKSIGIDQHFYHSIFRSIEEGKNIIRSANNGISAYVDSKGQIIKKIESTQKGVIEIDSYKKGSKTIFSSFGNKIFFYFHIFYITVIFIKNKGETMKKNYLFTSSPSLKDIQTKFVIEFLTW